MATPSPRSDRGALVQRLLGQQRAARLTLLALAALLVTALISTFVLQPVVSQAVAAASTGKASTTTSTSTSSTSKADYAVTASPTAQAVQQGKSVSYTVFVTATNGFTGTVTLSTGTLPSGLTGSLRQTSFDMRQGSQQSTTLTLTAARGTALQTYDVQVSGTSGRTVRTATVQLTVEKTPGSLSLGVGPATATVAPGGSAVYDVALNRTGSYSDTSVGLSVSGLPSGARATFDPTPTTGTASRLQVDTSTSTPDGTYDLVVTATAGSESFTASTRLVVSYSSRSFTVNGSVTQSLAPGAPAAPVALTFTNPNNRALSVTNVTVAITGVLPLAGRQCSTTDYAVAKQYTGPYPISVPAGGTRALDVPGADRSLFPHVVMVNKAVNQDGCKGAQVQLTLSGTGQGE